MFSCEEVLAEWSEYLDDELTESLRKQVVSGSEFHGRGATDQ